ncbi:MAG: ATP-binding protein [Alphaproteobacteria bacterium]|nr:ATP-binding protein [Alphaproteobacteria bacterium]
MDLSAELSALLSNRLVEIAELAAAVQRFLNVFDVPQHTVYEINLSLDELLTNIISYGYADDRRHLIQVSVGVTAGAIDVRIEDDAAPFDPFARKPVDVGAAIDDREPGGLGIHLVKEMMEHAAYQRLDGRNRVTLRRSFVAGDRAQQRE